MHVRAQAGNAALPSSKTHAVSDVSLKHHLNPTSSYSPPQREYHEQVTEGCMGSRGLIMPVSRGFLSSLHGEHGSGY